MKNVFALPLLCFCVAIAGEPSDRSNDSKTPAQRAVEPIGLVTIPTLLPQEGQPSPGKRIVPLRSEPNPTAVVLRSVSKGADFQSIEFANEQMGAWVFEKRPGWFKVRAGTTTGWIDANAAGRFVAIEELIGPQSYHRHYVTPDADLRIELNQPVRPEKPIDLVRPIVGLYELPAQKQTVFASPDVKSTKLREINADNPWVAKLDGRCPCGAIVTARKGNWIQLAQIEGDRSEIIAARGWTPSTSGRVLVAEVAPRLAEMRSLVYNWNRGDTIPARILETRRIDGRLWVHVTFEAEDACGEKNDVPKGFQSYWTRVFSDGGATLTWFHSRGC